MLDFQILALGDRQRHLDIRIRGPAIHVQPRRHALLPQERQHQPGVVTARQGAIDLVTKDLANRVI